MTGKKAWKILAFTFGSLIFILLILKELAFMNSSIVCGKIVNHYKLRGATYIEYEFFADEQKKFGTLNPSDLKSIYWDSLKKMECVKIEYSNYWTFFNRVIDKRILK